MTSCHIWLSGKSDKSIPFEIVRWITTTTTSLQSSSLSIQSSKKWFGFGYFLLNCLTIFVGISCLNFWDEACWLLSWRVFGLLSSSLLLFLQHFGRYVLRPSSGVCRTWNSSRNFELRPLLNKKKLNMNPGKKSYIIVVILVKLEH